MVSNLEHPFGTYRDVRNAELIGDKDSRLRQTANVNLYYMTKFPA